MAEDPTGRLYVLFACLLEYPTPAISQQVEACTEQLRSNHPEAAGCLERFQRGLEKLTLEQIEELYTVTFDMQPICCPYVGYHLFGENYKRGAFMARLNEEYRRYGYSTGNELPDHVAGVLRFLALGTASREAEFGRALMHEGLVPALEKMNGILETQGSNPYAAACSALLHFLSESTEVEVDNA